MLKVRPGVPVRAVQATAGAGGSPGSGQVQSKAEGEK